MTSTEIMLDKIIEKMNAIKEEYKDQPEALNDHVILQALVSVIVGDSMQTKGHVLNLFMASEPSAFDIQQMKDLHN